MPGLERVTKPTLDVLEVLLTSPEPSVHGWSLVKATGLTGPTVYGILDRLEGADWVSSIWEELTEHQNRPRRRCYTLTSKGHEQARNLLAERRPQVHPSVPGGVA